MADTLSSELSVSLAWVLEEARPFSSVIDASRLEYVRGLPDGTGSGQADVLWYDERTVAAGANDDLDLTALSGTLYGNTVVMAFARIKALLLINTETGAPATLMIGGAGAAGNAFSAPFGGDPDAKIELPYDSALMLSNKIDGWTVADASSDVLRVANPGMAAVTYRVAIVGTSA